MITSERNKLRVSGQLKMLKLPVNYISKRKPTWKELMVGIFVSVIVCSLHMPEKNHMGMILSAAHLCVSAQEPLDRF